MAALRFLLLGVAILVAGGCAYLAEKQGELIFRPVSGEWRGYNPAQWSFQEHWITVGATGDKLHAWWLPAESPTAPVMLYLHGARWNLSGSVTRIDRWKKLGFSVLAVDYRGFGKSASVSPTEELAYEDAEAAFAYLAQLAPGKPRYVVGHSLGGAIAAELARRQPEVQGVVLEATFTSIKDMIANTGWSYLPVDLILTQRFDTLSKIGEVRAPILITHGTNDSIVPFEMGEKLYAAAKSKKRFIRVEGGSHHNLSYLAFDQYREALKDLFSFQ
jgi:alpha-beta hydrolase superfamily lysophospholipase